MPDDLVVVATYYTLEEAHIAKGLLEAHDIDVLLNDARVTGIFGTAVPNRTVRLSVRAEDADVALEILNTEWADEDAQGDL